MRRSAANRGLDLTKGNIAGKLLLFAGPLLAASFIQLLYNTVDLLFAGNLLGSRAQAAVGASSLFITCVVGFFTGISVGCSVVTAQAVGAEDRAKTDRIIHSALGLGLAAGTALTILGELTVPYILRLMHTPESILADAVLYVRIYLLSLLPMCFYNLYAGFIRATGDSASPMRMQLVGGLANVAGDALLIRIFGGSFSGMGALSVTGGLAGIAAATLITQTVSAAICLRYMVRGTAWGKLEFRRISLEGKVIGEIIRLGVPAGLQNFVITLSNVIVQTKVNRLGVEAIAGYSVYFKVELLNYLPIVAIGSAVMTFSGQNKGAGTTDRITKGIRIAIAIGAVYVLCYSALIRFFGNAAFGLFNPDPGVIAAGMRIVKVTFPFYWMYVLIQVYADAARGAGRSLQPMLIILATICVFRTLVLMFLTRGGVVTIERVALTYPAAWLAAMISLGLYWHRCCLRQTGQQLRNNTD